MHDVASTEQPSRQVVQAHNGRERRSARPNITEEQKLISSPRSQAAIRAKRSELRVVRSPTPGNAHSIKEASDAYQETVSTKNFNLMNTGEKMRLRNARTFVEEGAQNEEHLSGNKPADKPKHK